MRNAQDRPGQDRIGLSRALFPEAAARLDAALARFGRGSEAGSAGTGADFDGDFDAALDAEAALRFSGIGLSAVAGTSGGAVLQRAFALAGEATRELLGLPGLALPEPEAFEAVGYDWPRYAEMLEADPRLMPVPAPFGLGPDAWSRAFVRAAGLKGAVYASVESDGDGGSEPGDGPFVLSTEVRREFAVLDAVPAGSPVVVTAPLAEGSRASIAQARPATAWILRLVPAEPEPELLGLNHRHGGPHVALPEMLMLQLMRAVAGLPPLDERSFTWLAGELAGGRLAARHVFDAGTIRITARETGSQGPHLGARPPRS
ncbi:MAG: hypothetical protein J0H64_05545 [Actinobacteria bacterium]|nr:hypothetical protein [Actinomycetota bacterium]